MENLIVVYSVHIERHDDLAEKRIKSSDIKRNCADLLLNITFYFIFFQIIMPHYAYSVDNTHLRNKRFMLEEMT